ncbi:GntR family transcriptional regulator [Actinotalea sp. K2]|uniref:GntR family transcriptional regulator n=1 Tax=Actinotalea sp. K2 TaxID=2939438 RepID=UPI002017DA4C|nr:GntR family transcriptional regulator [Actinotalea sp. K2]MCL3861795.1 GntR family transcriptional regulator [Actinotalea sp. K2]
MARGIVVTSLVDALVDDLRDKVVSGAIAPGTPLTEQEVANRYDVARASARAAIERLTGEKVLVRHNHKTARVVHLGPADVRDIYRTRTYLESEVLRRLAGSRTVPQAAREANAEIAAIWAAGSWQIVDPDMRFHTSLIDALASPRTSAVYHSLAFEVKLCMAQLQGRQELSPEIIVAEHARILELIAAGDADGAAAMLDEHLARARERLAASLGGEAGPEAFVPSSALPTGSAGS